MNKKLLLTISLLSALPAVAAEEPNILVIYVDDLGYGDVGYFNPDSKIETPNIDRLAESGVAFMNAHASTSISGPSRYGAMSGRYAWRTDRKANNPKPGEQSWIEPERLTMAQLLKGEGYNTAAMGKWHLCADWLPAARAKRKGVNTTDKDIDYSKGVYFCRPNGFNYEMVNIADMSLPPQIHPQFHVPGRETFTETAMKVLENGYILDQPSMYREQLELYYAQNVLDYISTYAGESNDERFNIERDKPFYLYYAPHMPHMPLAPAPQFRGRSKVGLYGDYVMELDWIVGEIMDKLEKNNLRDNTMIIFASDNGPEVFSYSTDLIYDHQSMGKARGSKRSLYLAGHRVPCVVSYPAEVQAGRRSERLVCFTDFICTFADLLGVEYNDRYAEDSFSFIDELIPEKSSSKVRDHVISHSAVGQLSIQKGDWVFINDKTGDVGQEPLSYMERIGVVPHDEPYELFNIKEDPMQLRNVIKENPEKAEELRALLGEYIFMGRTAPYFHPERVFKYPRIVEYDNYDHINKAYKEATKKQ